MGLSTEVPDGATQRHSRMMELLTFINLGEPRGATITNIQSHMLTVFGLKFKTTTQMVRELTLADTIKPDGDAFYHLTEKQRTPFKTMIAQEQKEKLLHPLLRLKNGRGHLTIGCAECPKLFSGEGIANTEQNLCCPQYGPTKL